MTINTFLRRVKKLGATWRIRAGYENEWTRRRAIRRRGTNNCPICAVAGIPGSSKWRKAAGQLGLSPGDAFEIIRAADSQYVDAAMALDGNALRGRLLAACGLPPEVA